MGSLMLEGFATEMPVIPWADLHEVPRIEIGSVEMQINTGNGRFKDGARLAIKQAGLTACLACLIGNQASQQAKGPDLGKPAS